MKALEEYHSMLDRQILPTLLANLISASRISREGNQRFRSIIKNNISDEEARLTVEGWSPSSRQYWDSLV